MQVIVHFFGAEAQTLGRDRLAVELPEAEPTCGTLRTYLSTTERVLAEPLRTARFAVNHAFAPDTQRLMPGDEVALIGMVSGG
ncbi:MAG: MoaD/ThiS family protein [Phycisphaerales bacterium]|nr:MoaD/ThiS family protein [Phycisphaerales bacterium]